MVLCNPVLCAYFAKDKGWLAFEAGVILSDNFAK